MDSKRKFFGLTVAAFTLFTTISLHAEVGSASGLAQPSETAVESTTPATSVLATSNMTKAQLPQALGEDLRFLASGGECLAGGPGSTSCTYGSCRVEKGDCEEGYACCGTDVCGCSSGAAQLEN